MAVYKGNTVQGELSQGSNAFAEAYKGSQKVYTKSGGIPTFGTRLNDMCTVVGTIIDSTGQDLIYATLDMSYWLKNGNNTLLWSRETIDTGLPNYDEETYENELNSATENTNYILNTYDNNKYPLFKKLRNQATITIKNVIYYSQVPTAREAVPLIDYGAELNNIDPTYNNYRSTFPNGYWSYFYSSTENDRYQYLLCGDGEAMPSYKNPSSYSIDNVGLPIFEIPVSAFM